MLRIIAAWAANRRLKQLEAQRQIALRAYDEARKRRDTRDSHYARLEALKLTSECVRVQVQARGR